MRFCWSNASRINGKHDDWKLSNFIETEDFLEALLKTAEESSSTRFWVRAAPKSWSKYTTNTTFANDKCECMKSQEQYNDWTDFSLLYFK